MIVFLCCILFAALLFLFSLMGRTGHQGLSDLRGWYYAHRGLHGNGIPENSMAAFRKALEHGYGVELDIHLMKDGNLAVIHDASLKRTAGVDLRIEDLRQEDLIRFPLEGTDEVIPTFHQVLELVDGRAPLIVELKTEHDNFADLTQKACDLLAQYHGVYCVESFDPRCIYWLKKNRPEVIRGQLAENFLRQSKSKLSWLLRFIMSFNMLNFLTRPDFIAYKFADRKNISVFLCRKLWRIQGVTWTLRDQTDHATSVKEGWIPIFEEYHP